MKKFLLYALFFIGLSVNANAKDFKFALFSDLHISQNPEASEDLDRAVKQINKTPDISFVLISGDITEEGDRKSMEEAKRILDQLSVKYYIVPGNHDTKWTESGATCFAQIFGYERFKFEHEGFLFLGFNSGPLIRIADGHVSPQDINWMKKELSKVGKEKPVFLITHYPIREGDVDNWFEVTDAVRPYNIKSFIGGHYHNNLKLFYDGIPGFLGRSTLRAKNQVGGYTVFSIESDNIKVSEVLIGSNPKEWSSLSLSKKYYDSKKLVDKRPNYNLINDQYPYVKKSWTLQAGAAIYASPVVYKNHIYVGDENGLMLCLDKETGEKIWDFKAGNRIVGSCDVEKNIVVFGAADNTIYGLNAQNGTLLWKIPTKEPVLGAVAIDKGIAYIGASDYTMRAINIKNGEIIWSYKQIKGYIETRPLITKKHLIFGAWDNTLYCLDKKTGVEKWKWTGGLTRMHYSPAAVWPVQVDEKIVFIVNPYREMVAIDINTGKDFWRTRESTVRESIGLSKDKKRVFGKTMNDSIVAFEAKTKAPKKIWATNVGFGYEFAPSQLIEQSGSVFGSTKNGMLFALDSKTGKLIWKYLIGNCLVNTVWPLPGNKLLYTSTSGEIGMIEWKNKSKQHE